jgi:hypothetical protein
MINNWKTLDSSCVNTVCCEHVFTTWYRAFLNNNALMVRSMRLYPKDITRNFLEVSMSTAICFPIRSIAEQQTYCTLGAIQIAIAILSDRLSVTATSHRNKEDLLGIRPNYFENLGLASFQISRISRPRGPSAAGPKLFAITFRSAFLLESSQAARCKIYIWKSVDDFEKEGQERYLANPAHETRPHS